MQVYYAGYASAHELLRCVLTCVFVRVDFVCVCVTIFALLNEPLGGSQAGWSVPGAAAPLTLKNTVTTAHVKTCSRTRLLFLSTGSKCVTQNNAT